MIGPTVDSGNAAGTVAYLSPGSGRQRADRQHRDDLRLRRHAVRRAGPSPEQHGGGGDGGGGDGERRQGPATATASRERRDGRGPGGGSAELASYLGGHGAAVGPALDLRLERAHHLAHGLHALAAAPTCVDRRRHQRRDLARRQLLGQVLGDDLGLRPLLGGALRPAGVVEGRRPPRGASSPRWSARRRRRRR